MMVKPLSFKGDSKPKIKKRKRSPTFAALSRPHADTPTSSSLARGGAEEDDDGWTTPATSSEITGPTVIVLPTETPSALSCDTSGSIFPLPLVNFIDGNPDTAEPHDVRQVWVANRVAGTEQFSFKGHHGRYLGCDKVGVLSATKEAVGPEESWEIILTEGRMFAVKNMRDLFIRCDEVPSSKKEGRETKVESKSWVRGDADSINFDSSLRIRMQSRFRQKHKIAKEEKAREKISRKELEDAVGRKLEDEEVKALKKARRDGSYHEALLDVKVKGKHDKFA